MEDGDKKPSEVGDGSLGVPPLSIEGVQPSTDGPPGSIEDPLKSTDGPPGPTDGPPGPTDGPPGPTDGPPGPTDDLPPSTEGPPPAIDLAPSSKISTQPAKPLAAGCAPIKSQFIDHHHIPRLAEEYLPQSVVDDFKKIGTKGERGGNNGEEPPMKKAKLKGRNKKRPFDQKTPQDNKLCPNVVHNRECRFGDTCRFSHDVQAYLGSKPLDMEGDCYAFKTYGICQYGVTCVFAKSHLTEDFKNKIDEETAARWKDVTPVVNMIDRELQFQLRRKKYDFKKANSISSQYEKQVKAQQKATQEECKAKSKANQEEATQEECKAKSKANQEEATQEECKAKSKANQEEATQEECKAQSTGNQEESSVDKTESCHLQTSVDSVDDSECAKKPSCALNTSSKLGANGQSGVVERETGDCLTVAENALPCPEASQPQSDSIITEGEGVIKLRPVEHKKIDFRDKLYLAPLTTVGNLPFRRVCKKLGADVTCGEMALTANLLQGQNSEWALLRRHESEDLFGVQLCGAYPDTMTRCAQVITEHAQVDFIDINCGCPIDLVFKKGEGSALMARTGRFEQIVRSMTEVMGGIPLTVKIRTGIYSTRNIAHTLVPRLRDWGASLVTVHGRSREQRYTRLADWEYINTCCRAADPMPVFGNGDILSYEDYNEHRRRTSVAGCMIARGALIKPWIFTEIKEQRHWDISSSERLDLLRDFCNYGLTNWGSDDQGVATTRRFLLEWLSFLHRYIPVGLLERVPQKINQKPPYYFGRDDLETLMASGNCADWVKISEMLLGPVPSGFIFLPKHKANAYQ